MVDKTEMIIPMVDVGPDFVVLNFPELDAIRIADDDLDNLFTYPEMLYDFCDREQFEFWSEVIPHVLRVRNQKRDLYDFLGFGEDYEYIQNTI